MARIQTAKSRIIRFLESEVWRLDKSDLTGLKAVLLRPLQILLMAVQGYVRDDCALRASALTFYSLLSVVPVAAMAFGIAKGFGLEQRLEELLYEQLAGQEAVMEKIIVFARSLLANTQGGLIAGIGVALLFWSAVKVLNHIEGSLNQIWGVKSRSFVRKFTDYLSILVISPLLIVVSSSINLFIMTQVAAITERLALLKLASPAIVVILRILPFALVWLLFLLIYVVLPNTRVRFASALAAGIIAGTLFQIFQGLYIHAQLVLSKYNAVYGSFAALPFFLIWLFLSWMVVLFGAQIAHAHQHVDQYAMQMDYQELNASARKRHALLVMHMIVSRFQRGETPPTQKEIAADLGLPSQLVARLLDHLAKCRLVAAVQMTAGEAVGYQPARDIHHITVADVLFAWDQAGRDAPPDGTGRALHRISEVLRDLEKEVHNLSANRLIKDL